MAQRHLGTRGAAQPASEKEQTLEKRAKDLEKRKKELEEEVERSGLGPDLKPVPEPTVRDLSVPQAKGAKGRKTTPPEPVKPPEILETTIGDFPLYECRLAVGGREWAVLHTGAVVTSVCIDTC